MGMNIAVISPHTSKAGVSMISGLLGVEMAHRGRKTCVLNTRLSKSDLSVYFKLNDFQDKTSNPHRLIKMLREDAVKPEDVNDYCRELCTDCAIFTAGEESLEAEEHAYVIDYALNYFNHDFKIFEIDSPYEEYNSKVVQNVLTNAHVIIIVADPNRIELEKFKDRYKSLLNIIGSKPTIMVMNKYCPGVGSMKELASYAGIKSPGKWISFRYNPNLTWGANNGELKLISKMIDKEDIRFTDTASDLATLANRIVKVKVTKRKLSIEAQKKENR